MGQGEFLQKIFDQFKPKNSIEVGFDYGISTMFILENKHEMGVKDEAHIVIEPIDLGPAMYNIPKERLDALKKQLLINVYGQRMNPFNVQYSDLHIK